MYSTSSCPVLIPVTGSYVNTVRAMKCTGKDSTSGACAGYQVLKEAVKASTTTSTPVLSLNEIQELTSGRKYYFACSNRSNSWKNHSGIQIPPDVDQDLCVRLFRGELITESALESTSEPCSRIMGSGSGKKGKSECRLSFLCLSSTLLIFHSLSASQGGQNICRPDG